VLWSNDKFNGIDLQIKHNRCLPHTHLSFKRCIQSFKWLYCKIICRSSAFVNYILSMNFIPSNLRCGMYSLIAVTIRIYEKEAHSLCMLDNWGYSHTLRACNTYSFSSAKMVSRTRLNITFIRALPVYLCEVLAYAVLYGERNGVVYQSSRFAGLNCSNNFKQFLKIF